MNSVIVPLIGLGLILIFGAIIFFVSKNNKTVKNTAQNITGKIQDSVSNVTGQKKEVVSNETYKKNPNANVNKEDIFNFMEFDKIQDNMIVSKKGEKYTAVIKCKGINYNLMSEVEQLAVEEGFINFLNTLKFSIQLYVQAQNIDLNDSIKKFKDNMKGFQAEYEDLTLEYNVKVNSLDSTDEEIEDLDNKRSSALNVYEYGQDIVRYVEKLSTNKSMLQRSFYVLVSYYKSEITNAGSFSPEELIDICYSELFTRVENILSGLAMSSVSGNILDSNEIAELLYSAYNRDDKNLMDIEQALDAGFHRLFSTSKDALTKKNEMLLENMKKEAEYKAVQALAKAFEEGNITTVSDIEDQYDENTSKMAIDMIKNERIDPEIKEKAKKTVVDEYKKVKKARQSERQKELEEMQRQINNSKEEERQINEGRIIKETNNGKEELKTETTETSKVDENIDNVSSADDDNLV